MKDKNQKQTLCLVVWVGFAICVTMFLYSALYSAPLNGRAYWNGGISMLLTVGQFLLALHYTKAMRKTERILIEDTSVYDETELLIGILSLPKDGLDLYDVFRERMIDNLVKRIALNPYCLGTASKVEFLLSQEGTIWSSQILVILEGIKVEELTLEQIIKLLKRSDSIIVPNLFSRVSKFRTALLQELLRKEKDGKGELTAEDLTVLEKLKDGFIDADLRCLELRLELGVRNETARELAEQVEHFSNQIALDRSGKPVTQTPPPVATSVC